MTKDVALAKLSVLYQVTEDPIARQLIEIVESIVENFEQTDKQIGFTDDKKKA